MFGDEDHVEDEWMDRSYLSKDIDILVHVKDSTVIRFDMCLFMRCGNTQNRNDGKPSSDDKNRR